MRMLLKLVLAAITALGIWWFCKWMGLEPRGLDLWLLFSLEYIGVSMWFDKARE